MTVLMIVLFIDMAVITFTTYDLSILELSKSERNNKRLLLVVCVVIGIIISSIVIPYGQKI